MESSNAAHSPSRTIVGSVFALGLIATLAYASSHDFADTGAPSLAGLDKLAHFLTFGLMGTLWFRALPLPFASARRFAAAWGLVLVYGLIDEWIQSGNPSRQADPLDWVADAAGSLLAIALYRGWPWYRGILETPVLALLAKARRAFSNPAR